MLYECTSTYQYVGKNDGNTVCAQYVYFIYDKSTCAHFIHGFS